MCPPVSAAMFKNAPPEGDTIAGTFIPGGTKVGICWWGLSRNKAIYGDDADMFRPERWLQADGERLERMEKTNDLIFSPGRWQCLGKSVAFLELNKCIGEVCPPQTLTFDVAKCYSCFATLTSNSLIQLGRGNLSTQEFLSSRTCLFE